MNRSKQCEVSRCMWCREETEETKTFCNQYCKEEYQDMSHPHWEAAINYEGDQEKFRNQLIKDIKSIDYENE
jgi:hypothetical protein